MALTRRDFFRLSGSGVVAAAAGPLLARAAAPAAGGTQRPNILWISVEDISCDLGCYGDGYAETPSLDAFAKQGCRYTHAFTTYPVCAPSRSSIITGMYPTTIGTMHMRTGNKGYQAVLPAEVKCFTEYLRAAGYYCTNAAKTDYQFGVPFTAWDRCHGGAHWRQRPQGAPFFTVINLGTTHESRIRTPRDRKPTHDPAKAKIPPYYPDTPVVRNDWARYHDNITAMDKQVAKILKDLADDGLAKDTVVFFWSDHGRGLPRAKRWPYDSGTHVPLMVRWPGKVQPASVCDDLISLMDLGPTVLSIAGVRIPKHVQGRAFLGSQKAEPRKYVVTARDRMDERYDRVRSIRDKHYRYIRNFMPQLPYAQTIRYMELMPTMREWRRLNAEGKLEDPQKLFFQKTKPVEELYDIAADPHEVHNLAGSPKHQDVLQRMRKVLEQWIRDNGDLGAIPETKLIERMWPGGRQPVTAAPIIEASPAAGGAVTVRIACATKGAWRKASRNAGGGPRARTSVGCCTPGRSS